MQMWFQTADKLMFSVEAHRSPIFKNTWLADSDSRIDFPVWKKNSGVTIVSQVDEIGGYYWFLMQVSSDPIVDHLKLRKFGLIY